MIKEIYDSNFVELIYSDKSNKPVLVDFWAPWCNPCKTLSVLLNEIFNEYKNKVLFFKLNVDDNPQYTAKYDIRSIPTIIFFKNGEKKDLYIGVASKDEIRKKLNNLL